MAYTYFSAKYDDLPNGDYISAYDWAQWGEYSQTYTKFGAFWTSRGVAHSIPSRLPDDLVAVDDLVYGKRQSLLRFLVEGHDLTPELAARMLDAMGER